MRSVYVLRPFDRYKKLVDDLRVVIVYEAPSTGIVPPLEGRVAIGTDTGLHPLLRGMFPYEHQLKRALLTPSDTFQLYVVRRIYDIMQEIGRIKRGDLAFLWSPTDKDYLPRLQALHDDPAGGRPREPIIGLTRLNDSMDTMERVLDMLDREELSLTRLHVPGIDAKLNPYHSHWLSCWTECQIVDAQSLPLVRLSLWWLQQHQQTAEVPQQAEIWSKMRTHRVNYGRPSLARLLNAFDRLPNLKKQCLVVPPRGSEANDLLIFERGPNWSAQPQKSSSS